MITGAGNHADIPGGDSLVAQSFAQTVVGFHNKPEGAFVQGSKSDFTHNHTHADDPLVIVGNGTIATQSNAFEVSYDGHSVVYDQLRSFGRNAVFGGAYNDNTSCCMGRYCFNWWNQCQFWTSRCNDLWAAVFSEDPIESQ